jgi:hypothetical protein
MLDETPDLLNQNIIIILRNRQFFADLEELNKILAPIKKACTILESKNTTLIDCFLQLVILAMEIQSLSEGSNQNFRNNCIEIFNRRWKQFDFDLYILAYFFHPKYRGMF